MPLLKLCCHRLCMPAARIVWLPAASAAASGAPVVAAMSAEEMLKVLPPATVLSPYIAALALVLLPLTFTDVSTLVLVLVLRLRLTLLWFWFCICISF